MISAMTAIFVCQIRLTFFPVSRCLAELADFQNKMAAMALIRHYGSSPAAVSVGKKTHPQLHRVPRECF